MRVCECRSYKERWLRGSKSFQSTVEGLGKCGWGMETIAHPSLQWGKSFQAATEISTGEITLTCCCAIADWHWHVWGRLCDIMVIPLKTSNPILLSHHDPCKQIYRQERAGRFEEGKTVMAFNLSDTHPTFDTSQQQTVIFIVWYESGL